MIYVRYGTPYSTLSRQGVNSVCFLNAALEGEMDAHLTEKERQMGNCRNGKMQKQVQTPLGEVTVSTPRDRNSSFDPQFIKKRETILAEGVADRIIGLYALGNSTREISGLDGRESG